MLDIYSKDEKLELAEVWAGGDIDAIYLGNTLVWPDKSAMDGGYILQLPTWEENREARAAMEHVRLAYLNEPDVDKDDTSVGLILNKSTSDSNTWFINAPQAQSSSGRDLRLQGNILAIPAHLREALDSRVGTKTAMHITAHSRLYKPSFVTMGRGNPSKEVKVIANDGEEVSSMVKAGPSEEQTNFEGTLTIGNTLTALASTLVTIIVEVKNIPSGGIAQRIRFAVELDNYDEGVAYKWGIERNSSSGAITARLGSDIGKARVEKVEYEDGEFFTENTDYATEFKLTAYCSSHELEVTGIMIVEANRGFDVNILGKF